MLLLWPALWFGFLELRGLYFPDEGRYAEIPREMLASGDWVTPRLNGIPYFEKPPLQYWATAAVFAIAGEDEWTARIAPATMGFLAALAVGATARRLYSRRAAWMAMAVFASSVGYFLANQFLTLDVTLTALLTGALCAFLLGQRDGAGRVQRRTWMLLAWALCGLAFLTKGAVALVIPGMAVLAYILVQRDASLLARLHWRIGGMVFTLVTLPWLYAVQTANRDFLHFFFVIEHWERFTSAAHQRPGPWWYFLPVGLAFSMPWAPALAMATTTKWRRPEPVPPVSFDPIRFCVCWTGMIFLFFSVSASKLPAYILPSAAGIALAAAPALVRRWRATVALTACTLIGGGCLGTVLAMPAAQAIRIDMVRHAYEHNVAWVTSGASILALAGLLTLLLLRNGRPLAALATLALGGMLGCQMAMVTAYHIDAHFSSERLIEGMSGGVAVRPFEPDTRFYSVDFLDHTVPFYLGRTVILVKERGELAWGTSVAPESYLREIGQFADGWRAESRAFAIMRVETYDELVTMGLPMHIIAQDGRRVVVARHELQ